MSHPSKGQRKKDEINVLSFLNGLQKIKIENGSPLQETPTMITIKEKP